MSISVNLEKRLPSLSIVSKQQTALSKGGSSKIVRALESGSDGITVWALTLIPNKNMTKAAIILKLILL